MGVEDREGCRGATAAVVLVLTLLAVGRPAEAQTTAHCARAAPSPLAAPVAWFPAGTLFCPVLADRRETVSYLGAARFSAPWVNTTVAVTSVGDHIPLVRVPLGTSGAGLQVSIAAAVLGLFDLDVSSFDFINADFIVGLPVAVRAGPWSARARLYHWSSHIGDEFLLRDPSPVEREEISLEALELLVARRMGPARVVAGGEWWLSRVPGDLPPAVAVVGLEASSESGLHLGGGLNLRGRAGVHLRWSEVERGPSASLRGGVEFGRAAPGLGPERRLGIMFDWFDGGSPYGQFYRDRLRFTGFTIYFN